MGILRYCQHCMGINKTSKEETDPRNGFTVTLVYYTFYHGFVANDMVTTCPMCQGELTKMNLTTEEWKYTTNVSLDQDFIFAMDKLKQDDIIEFNIKIAKFKETYDTVELARVQARSTSSSSTQSTNIPKCPTCGSTDIKKISGTKRWLGTGLFGLASSDLGKTMQCNSCGYKF